MANFYTDVYKILFASLAHHNNDNNKNNTRYRYNITLL